MRKERGVISSLSRSATLKFPEESRTKRKGVNKIRPGGASYLVQCNVSYVFTGILHRQPEGVSALKIDRITGWKVLLPLFDLVIGKKLNEKICS